MVNPLDHFVSRYEHEYDFYDRLARLVADQLDARLRSDGVRAIVTGRAKRPERLRAKLEKRGKNYSTEDEIRVDIIDLAGVRAALYFPGDRERVSAAIAELFEEVRPVKRFPLSEYTVPPVAGWQKRFSGYAATHHLVRPRVTNLSGDLTRFASAAVEIQVGSVLMHAWAEVEHDLAYKPLSGMLSLDEQAILDELNGLVLAGEIALERLQRAGEARIGASRSPFASAYDLAAHLAAYARTHLAKMLGDSTLGRVDVLLNLIRKLNLDTPETLAPYLAAVHPDVERRPLVDQLVDGIVAGDDARVTLYRSLREFPEPLERAIDDKDADADKAIGRFLRRWSAFEAVLDHILSPEEGRPSPREGRVRTAPVQLIREASRQGYLQPEQRLFVDAARNVRNQLVHSAQPPIPQELEHYGSYLKNLLHQWQQSDNPALAKAARQALVGLDSKKKST